MEGTKRHEYSQKKKRHMKLHDKEKEEALLHILADRANSEPPKEKMTS